MGVPPSPERYAAITAYEDGVPDDALDALKTRLTLRAGFRVVNGGGV
jgi:hypothetical protein